MTLNLDDFQKQDVKFDIGKLQQAYKEVVKTHKFEDAGVTNFGAISLTQIPGEPDSIKGSNARGIFWTKPDQSGKEVSRDISIDESLYRPSDIMISRGNPSKVKEVLGWEAKFTLKDIVFAMIEEKHHHQ